MKITVLDAGTLGSDIDLSPITSLGECEVFESTPSELVASRLGDCDVAVLNKIKLNGTNLPFARNLKLICVTATGFDNIDIDYCKAHGIAVCNIPGYSTDSVAQLTVAMALSLSCKLSQYRDFVHSGEYSKSGAANRLTPVWHELSGKTWGIVGGGSIGNNVARVAEALGCRVIVCRRKPDPVFETVDIDTLCRTADIISIHVPLTDSTRGMINERRIKTMKRDAVVINVARGAVTDEDALARAIEQDELGGLAVDVYTSEPFDKSHPFNCILDRPNVILTPHTAWGSFEARTRCINEISLNIKAYFEGKIRNRVEK